MRNLLFFIIIFSLFSCNNAGKKEEMVLLDYSTNTIAYQGYHFLESIDKFCRNHYLNSSVEKSLVNARAIEKKYNNFIHSLDSMNDIDLMRKAIADFYIQNHSFFGVRDNFDISKLSSKEYIKNAATLIFCISMKEINDNLAYPDCSVHAFYNFGIFAKSDSIKLNEEFVGVITREGYKENLELISWLKNNYKVNFIKRNGVKVNDVKLNIVEKNRILKLKPAKKGHYEIEVSFFVLNRDSSTTEHHTPIVFDVY